MTSTCPCSITVTRSSDRVPGEGRQDPGVPPPVTWRRNGGLRTSSSAGVDIASPACQTWTGCRPRITGPSIDQRHRPRQRPVEVPASAGDFVLPHQGRHGVLETRAPANRAPRDVTTRPRALAVTIATIAARTGCLDTVPTCASLPRLAEDKRGRAIASWKPSASRACDTDRLLSPRRTCPSGTATRSLRKPTMWTCATCRLGTAASGPCIAGARQAIPIRDSPARALCATVPSPGTR